MPAFQKEKKNERAGKGNTDCHSKGLAEDQGVFQQSYCQALHPAIMHLRRIKIWHNKHTHICIHDKVTKYKYFFLEYTIKANPFYDKIIPFYTIGYGRLRDIIW